MKYKQGKTSPALMIFGIIALLLIGVIAFNYTQSAVSPGEEKEVTGDCNTAPSVDLTVLNADDDLMGTAITGYTTDVIRNGEHIIQQESFLEMFGMQ